MRWHKATAASSAAAAHQGATLNGPRCTKDQPGAAGDFAERTASSAKADGILGQASSARSTARYPRLRYPASRLAAIFASIGSFPRHSRRSPRRVSPHEAVQPAGVLGKNPAPGNRHRQKQGVEPRVIEAFAEITTRRHQHPFFAGPGLSPRLRLPRALGRALMPPRRTMTFFANFARRSASWSR